MKKNKDDVALEQAKAEAVRILTEAVERAVGLLVGSSHNEKFPTRVQPSKGSTGMLTTKQAAEYLGYKRVGSIYRLLEKKKLVGYRIGGRTLRFKREELDACIEPFKLKTAGA